MVILTLLKACKSFSFLNGILLSQVLNEVIDEDVGYPEKQLEIINHYINQGNCGKQRRVGYVTILDKQHHVHNVQVILNDWIKFRTKYFKNLR